MSCNFNKMPGDGMSKPSSLGKYLRKLRLERMGKKPLTQREVGEKIGLTASMISQIERGMVPVKEKYLPRFIKFYKLNSTQVRTLRRLVTLQNHSQPVLMPYTEKATRLRLARLIKFRMDNMTLKEAKSITEYVLSFKPKSTMAVSKRGKKNGKSVRSK